MEHSCAGMFISSYDMLHIAEKLYRKTPTLNHLHKRAGLTMMQCILSYRRNSKGHTFSGCQIKPKALYQIPWDKTPLLLFYRLQLTYISGLVQAVTFLPHTPTSPSQFTPPPSSSIIQSPPSRSMQSPPSFIMQSQPILQP